MSPGLLALAIMLVAAGVIAIAARDPRTAIVAVTLVGVAGPALTESLPQPLPLAARLIAAILAGYLLLAAVRGSSATSGSAIGWPAEALVALAAGVAALSAARFATTPVGGLPEAAAVGFALLAVAAAPLLVGRDALRLTIAALLAVQAASLVRAGMAGPAAGIDELALAGLIAALGGVGAGLVVRARVGSGGLELGARRPATARTAATLAVADPVPRTGREARRRRRSEPP